MFQRLKTIALATIHKMLVFIKLRYIKSSISSKLLIVLSILLIFLIILAILVQSPHKWVPAFAIIIDIILIVLIYSSIGIIPTLIANFGLTIMILTLIVSIKPFFDEGNAYIFTMRQFIVVLIIYLALLINLIIMSYNILRQKEPDIPGNSTLLRIIGFAIEKIAYKFSFILVIVLYIFLVYCTIIMFGGVYESYNIATADNINRGILFISNKSKVMSDDLLYFSSATFFTGSYGDIIPVDQMAKKIVVIEMFLGYILNVIYIPILLNILSLSFKRIIQSKEIDS